MMNCFQNLLSISTCATTYRNEEEELTAVAALAQKASISYPDEAREAARGGGDGDPSLDLTPTFNPSSSPEDSPPPLPPTPLILTLLEENPELFKEVLARLEPADFAVLAQVAHPLR